MAHQRTTSAVAATDQKEPHSVSLKVLRLSRPTLTAQHPLPSATTSSLASHILPAASLAYPSAKGGDSFIISPLLTLPPAFGNAYVGETFACTLCANNEIAGSDEGQDGGKKIGSVKIEAEMKTPSSTVSLDLAFAKEQNTEDFIRADGEKDGKGTDLGAGTSLQGIVDFHLKEEGNHVLAVTVSYNETGATSGKVRSFRKLYQFVARGCIVVRTKIGPLPDATVLDKEGKKVTRARYALEAQLENCGEDIIVLDSVGLEEKPWCKATSLNWQISNLGDGEQRVENPVLGPGDVQQVCFLVDQKSDEKGEIDATGRMLVGMLTIGWRGAMGNRGSLSTGWLGTRPR